MLAATGRSVAYDIVGDGPLSAELKRLAQELDVVQKVKFHGWRERGAVIELLQRSDVFVTPSVTSSTGEQEGVPVALMEAMAMGMPAVRTWHSGIPEFVENGRTGLLVAERDMSGLYEQFRYLTENPQVWVVYGIIGRAAVEQQHNIHSLKDRLLQLFGALVGRTDAGTSQRRSLDIEGMCEGV